MKLHQFLQYWKRFVNADMGGGQTFELLISKYRQFNLTPTEKAICDLAKKTQGLRFAKTLNPIE